MGWGLGEGLKKAKMRESKSVRPLLRFYEGLVVVVRVLES